MTSRENDLLVWYEAMRQQLFSHYKIRRYSIELKHSLF